MYSKLDFPPFLYTPLSACPPTHTHTQTTAGRYLCRSHLGRATLQDWVLRIYGTKTDPVRTARSSPSSSNSTNNINNLALPTTTQSSIRPSSGPLSALTSSSSSSSLMTTAAAMTAKTPSLTETPTLLDGGRHVDNVGPRSGHDSVPRSKTGTSHETLGAPPKKFKMRIEFFSQEKRIDRSGVFSLGATFS